MRMIAAGWYLIYTKPRHEKKVFTDLKQKNINSFLPTTKKLRVWSERKKYIDEPLFPSYVFVYLDNLQHYYTGKDAEGALYYVRKGKEIARVNDSIVNNIRLTTCESTEIEVLDMPFQPGRQLVISKGALTGLSCEVVQYKGKDKLLVRVDLLQRNILVTLSSEYLMAI